MMTRATTGTLARWFRKSFLILSLLSKSFGRASKRDYGFHRLLPPLPDLLSCHPSQHLGGRAAAFYGDENFDEADHDDHDDEGNNQKLVNDGYSCEVVPEKLSNFVSTLKICQ